MSDRLDAPRARAAAFVLERGGPLEQLRARVLSGERPPGELSRALADQGALSSSDPEALLPALLALDDVDQLGGPAVEGAVKALVEALGEDGSWGAPGRPLEERIVLTASLGALLAKTLQLRPRVRAAIDGFLCRTWSPERVKAGVWEPVAAYAHWFSLSDSELSDAALQWCGRELERGFRTRRFDAVATARVFLLCHAAALPGTSLSAAELCEALANEQTEDGGFGLSARALAGDPVGAALDGLAAWRRLAPPPEGP